ncbi:pheromone alpha, partial [Cryptococcus neoformans c45]
HITRLNRNPTIIIIVVYRTGDNDACGTCLDGTGIMYNIN